MTVLERRSLVSFGVSVEQNFFSFGPGSAGGEHGHRCRRDAELCMQEILWTGKLGR